MTKAFIYWFIILLWVIFGVWANWPNDYAPRHFAPLGGSMMEFILFVLIGLKIFGNPVAD